MSKIIAFPQPETPTRSLAEFVEIAHELAKTSEKVYLDNPHVRLRMGQRSVGFRQILDVLREGKGIDGPIQDKHGDWRIKLKKFTCGRVVQVVVAFKKDHLEVITVI